MSNADISDGDYIIIDPLKPKDGEIGVIRYRGETTLKPFEKKGIVLPCNPENPSFDPIDITSDEWEEDIMVF